MSWSFLLGSSEAPFSLSFSLSHSKYKHFLNINKMYNTKYTAITILLAFDHIVSVLACLQEHKKINKSLKPLQYNKKSIITSFFYFHWSHLKKDMKKTFKASLEFFYDFSFTFFKCKTKRVFISCHLRKHVAVVFVFTNSRLLK